MIEFIEVSKRYPGQQDALSDISLQLPQESMTFLTGHSGAGKSTLLKLLTRLEAPTQGQILVAGYNISRFTRAQIPFYRRKIGIVLQDPHLLYDRNVFANVALPLQLTGQFSILEIGRRVRAALDKVQLLDREKTLPIRLSAGERQRISIARAIVAKPQILLADEPTGNLDPTLASEILQLFVAFHQIGVTVLIATHDLALLNQTQANQIVLKQGRIVPCAA